MASDHRGVSLTTTGRGSGTPTQSPPSTRVPCTTCDARIGQRCQRWKIADGARLYRLGTLAKQHQSRRDAARKAGHVLPAGRTPDKDTR